MFFNSRIKKVLVFAIMLLVGCITLIPLNPNSNITTKDLLAITHASSKDNVLKIGSNMGAEMFVPNITLLKESSFNPSDCGQIPFTFTVENTSDAGEVFVNIEITDTDLGGVVASGNPDFGDDNSNGSLDPGEKWVYNVLYIVTQNDLESGSFGSQPANVMADVQGQGIQITDLSHPSDATDDGPTIVDLTPCQNISIGLIMPSTPQDLDTDGCVESFLFDYTVFNNGNVSLQNVVLEDNFLGGVISPILLLGGDAGNDGIMNPGEQWQYQALYGVPPQPNTIFNSQSSVTAETVGQGVPVMDLSHPTDFFLDDTTSSPYDQTCNSSHAIIGMIKQASPLDLDSDGCPETIQYRFLIENRGDVPLEEVELYDDFLGGQLAGPIAGSDLNSNGILDFNETWIYEAQYPITQQDVFNGSVVNQALVIAEPENFDFKVFDYSDNDSYDEDQSTAEQMEDYCAPPGIGLIKQTSGDLEDLDNDSCPETIRYRFTIRNLGGYPLENIVITDPQLNPVNVPIVFIQSTLDNDDILSPNEEWTLEALYPLTGVDVNAGVVVSFANVSAQIQGTQTQVSDRSDDDSYFEDEDTSIPVENTCPAVAAIGLTKTTSSIINPILDQDGDGCPETIGYRFTVRNTGSLNLAQISLTDLDLTLTINGPLSDTGNDGILSPTEEWVYEAFYPLTQQNIDDGSVTNQAEVTALDTFFDVTISDLSHPSDFSDDGATITSTAGACFAEGNIALVKAAQPILQDLDGDSCPEIINYVLTVQNTGNIPLEQIAIDDPQLNGLLTGPQSDAGNDNILSPGEEWVFTAAYPITDQDITAGSITNNANVTAVEEGTSNIVSDQSDDISFQEDGDTTVLVDCAATVGIALLKTTTGTILDTDGDGCPETIAYEFTVRNTGGINLDQINLTDLDLPSLNIIGPNGDDGDGVLSPLEEWTYDATYPLTEQDVNNGSVSNRAQVNAQDTFFGNPVMDLSDHTALDQDRATVTLTVGACFAQASIGLIKEAVANLADLDNDGCPDNISYIFTVDNTGSIPLEQVVLSDILMGPDPISGPLSDVNSDQILSPGESWTYQAYYPITEQDIQATFVRNQANVMAFEQGTMNMVTDDSDDNSFDENGETVTSVAGACVAEAAISLTKNATPVDGDGDGCPEAIQYTFIVDNIGAIDLNQVTINDNMLTDPINGPLNNSDVNGDGTLSTTETWVYEALYSLTPEDYEAGLVTNQAQVTALEVVANSQINAESEEIVVSLSSLCDPIDPVNPNFEIFNGITPNGDGINDFFEISGIESYPDNLLQVFNRWGVLVFEAEGYGIGSALFAGQSEGRATVAKERALPTGTYFYTLTFTGNNPGQEVYSGYMYISRD